MKKRTYPAKSYVFRMEPDETVEFTMTPEQARAAGAAIAGQTPPYHLPLPDGTALVFSHGTDPAAMAILAHLFFLGSEELH